MKVVCFGDLLIHFSPLGDERFAQVDLMQVGFTGAEANVCAALGLWGEHCEFFTRLPSHALAEKGLRFLRGFGIETAHVPRATGRMGAYYLENGRSLRPSAVIYDRDGSAFTTSRYTDYDWDAILGDADIFYLSGITPFLSEELSDCCLSVLQETKRRGISVFLDLNYRSALGSTEKFSTVIGRLLPYVTCLIGNEEHFKATLGVSSSYGEEEREARLYDLAARVRETTGIEQIAITVRRTLSADETVICAALSRKDGFAVSAPRRVAVVDRVGSGDAFSAGLVYALIHGFDAQEAVDFASASSAIKHTVVSDVNFATVEEIRSLMKNSPSDVRR